ncbi:hypothetical protein GTQ40_11070 [Flavobacteriaceae bacterium R38]|nr:hypothetical protein [Flavobacteriaceae bacterium R38]
MIPMFYLYDIESLDEALFTDESSEYLKNTYDLKSRLDIYSNLEWAELNPNFPFESIMDNAPVVGKLKFSNEEVHQYLMSFKAFMENEDFKLLTDDREPRNLEDFI